MHSGFRFQNFKILDILGVPKIYKTQKREEKNPDKY